MNIRYLADQEHYKWMETEELREIFLVNEIFNNGALDLLYTEADRGIVGSAVPTDTALKLEGGKEIASEYFAQRREVGVINIGSKGTVVVDGTKYVMDNRDCLYIGRGSKDISFSSVDAGDPAYFYILSYPAHKEYPVAQAKLANAEPAKLGSKAEANERTIYKYIHPAGIKSCQLVMGLTELEEGSIWNTMSAHTHERRTEIYMYFDVSEKDVVFHFMGRPDETRHIVVRNRQAVISPSWSIHSGAGTRRYTFIWGMGGENQDFGDMDFIEMDHLQ